MATGSVVQVGVAVRHGLAADLDEPDHRDEHSDVPEPAHEQPGTPAPLEQRQSRQREDQRRNAGADGAPR